MGAPFFGGQQMMLGEIPTSGGSFQILPEARTASSGGRAVNGSVAEPGARGRCVTAAGTGQGVAAETAPGSGYCRWGCSAQDAISSLARLIRWLLAWPCSLGAEVTSSGQVPGYTRPSLSAQAWLLRPGVKSRRTQQRLLCCVLLSPCRDTSGLTVKTPGCAKPPVPTRA